MYKIAVMGDYDSIYGFAALGLETYPCLRSHEAVAQAPAPVWQTSDYAVIYITEALAAEIW